MLNSDGIGYIQKSVYNKRKSCLRYSIYLTNIGRADPLASAHALHHFVDRVKQSQEDEDEHADNEVNTEHAPLPHISG